MGLWKRKSRSFRRRAEKLTSRKGALQVRYSQKVLRDDDIFDLL